MKAAVVLAGCGVYDGAEIHEAVMTLYAIDRNGGTYQLFAPNVMQHHVINHITGEVMKNGISVHTYNYTIPMLIFMSLGILAIFFALLLKAEDKKKGYGLELPNIKQ